MDDEQPSNYNISRRAPPLLQYVPPARIDPHSSLPDISKTNKRKRTTDDDDNSSKKKHKHAVAGGSITGPSTRHHDLHPLNILRDMASEPAPAENRTLSEQLAKLTLACERIMKFSLGKHEAVDVAELAWRNDVRLQKYWFANRASLSNEHRIAVWIARLRCIAVASSHCLEYYVNENKNTAAGNEGAANNNSTSSSSSSSIKREAELMHATHSSQTKELRQARLNAFSARMNTRQDRELFVAHSVLWPYDTSDNRLYQWCLKNELLPPEVHNVDDDVRSASMITMWKLTTLLLQRWMHLSYCSFLIAYTWRLLERYAAMSTYTGSVREFNHPFLAQNVRAQSGITTSSEDDDGNDQQNNTSVVAFQEEEYCITDRFLKETERVFFAVHLRLYRCSFLAWPSPRVDVAASSKSSLLRKKRAELLMPDALDRFDEFVTREIEHGRFSQYIEKQFEVVFFDHVLLPGEMERFEKLRPYDDRKPLTCLSRMRRNDYDRYNRMFLEPSLAEVWRYLMENKLHTHPAYMVIASRVVQFYFDSNYDGASFDTYFLDIDKLPMDHLHASVINALHMASHDSSAVLTRGSARHTLCGTLLRTGLECTKESQVPHPVIVMCVGTPCLVVGEESVVVKQKNVELPHFGTVFLAWLREMCADERLAGTLANGKSLLPLFRYLQPTQDTEEVARRAEQIRVALERERVSLTGLEDEVHRLNRFVPRKSDASVLVL